MSGKTIIAFVALAASSASAATATIAYTRIFQPQPVHTLAAGSGGASVQGHAESAVVLNASEGFSFADSDGDRGSPACLSDGDSQRCTSGLRGSDVRLQILGSTPTFPPIWLGGDSEDRYTLDGNSFFRPAFGTSSPFELVVQDKINRPNGQTGASDQYTSQTDGVQASSNSSNFAFEIIAPSPLAHILDRGFSIVPVDQLGHDPLSAFVPIDALPVAEPLIGSVVPAPPDPSSSSCCVAPGTDPLSAFVPIDALPVAEPLIGSAIPAPTDPSPFVWPETGGSGTAPEPSTWVMMLVGFASLGFAGYHASRKRAALAV